MLNEKQEDEERDGDMSKEKKSKKPNRIEFRVLFFLVSFKRCNSAVFERILLVCLLGRIHKTHVNNNIICTHCRIHKDNNRRGRVPPPPSHRGQRLRRSVGPTNFAAREAVPTRTYTTHTRVKTRVRPRVRTLTWPVVERSSPEHCVGTYVCIRTSKTFITGDAK